MAELKYEGLEISLKITDVPKLEKMNLDISINVLFMRIAIHFQISTV